MAARHNGQCQSPRHYVAVPLSPAKTTLLRLGKKGAVNIAALEMGFSKTQIKLFKCVPQNKHFYMQFASFLKCIFKLHSGFCAGYYKGKDLDINVFSFYL